MIQPPFLLYIGHSSDFVGIKTSRGLATFRPEDCVGEFRHDDSPLSLGLVRLSMREAAERGAKTLVLGIAHAGGAMAPALIADAAEALRCGMHVASGLHHRLRDEPELAALARERGLDLIDVRDPPADLKVGTGAPREGRRVLTVGTDCSVGKMYAALALTKGLRAHGQKADFRATGQTGILIAGSGVPVDAVVADFISGAIERITPPRDDGGWDVVEGQGSLFHPSFAGVSLGLLHGAQAEAIVMCHDPSRREMRGLPGRSLPGLEECIATNLQLGRLTSPHIRCAGVCLNTSSMGDEAARQLVAETEQALGLPVTDPHRFGTAAIVESLCAS